MPVVYTARPGEWKSELGDYLGDLTDEVPDNRIIEFVTGGPKKYAYKIARPDKDGQRKGQQYAIFRAGAYTTVKPNVGHYRIDDPLKIRTVACCSPA
jgi:hypothetical protein